MLGGDQSRSRKAAAMANEVAALEAALGSAQAEYARVKARNEEVRRLAWRTGVATGWRLRAQTRSLLLLLLLLGGVASVPTPPRLALTCTTPPALAPPR